MDAAIGASAPFRFRPERYPPSEGCRWHALGCRLIGCIAEPWLDPARAGHSAAFVGLPGNPVAVFVTFVRVVKPLLRRLSGARQDKIVPLPVRAAFAYRKKKDRREYVRVALRRAADGEVEAVKHPQDGAGILTSLTQTDGLLEFPEDVTTIEPGARVGFLSYAALVS